MGFGFLASFVGMLSLALQLKPGTEVWALWISMAVIGVGNAFIWAPTAATATRNLPMHLAGAGSGVYNATRQVGSVIGSAAIAVIMDSRLAALLPGASAHGDAGADKIPDPHVASLFSEAMRDAVYLPVVLFVVGFLAVLCYEAPKHQGYGGARAAAGAGAGAGH
jgi:hypothetical protein